MLKRAYGSPIDIYKLVDSRTDLRTGVRTVEVAGYHIRRAIILPVTTNRKGLMRKMSAGTEAVRDFQASGSYDVGKGSFIVDRADIPASLRLTHEDWIVYQSRKYPVDTVEEFEMGGWIITVGELLGEVSTAPISSQIFSISFNDTLTLTDGVSDES